ncbi:AraC family ligand binding domain-containing protein, partial [Salmonella enterica]|nr:AraC family ligand binding domain-containing protein [Salmonella enterica subsp. enterica serovar Give]
MTMLTEHSFPRHSHDQFGIGIMTMGAQRSWSSLGKVESHTGDIIMVGTVAKLAMRQPFV